MPIKHIMDDDFENPVEKIFFLCRHIDHIGKTTENFELMQVAEHIERHLNVLSPEGRDEPPEVEPSFFLENFEDYKKSCYIVFLERGYDLTSPAKSPGEDMMLSDHIRTINLFRECCRLARIPIPAFEVQGAEFEAIDFDFWD